MKKVYNKKMYPEWENCAWRRKACGQDNCPICGKINLDRQRHLLRGEDPDSFDSVFDDMSKMFKDLSKKIMEEMTKLDVDITNLDNVQDSPLPESFPLYQKIFSWSEQVFKLLDRGNKMPSWTTSEAGMDLIWYAHTLNAKTARQLSNRWFIDNNIDEDNPDLYYTGEVLKEVFEFLKNALTSLIITEPNKQKEFKLLYIYLTALGPEVLALSQLK